MSRTPRPFYVAYLIGNRKGLPVYKQPHKVYGLVSTPSSLSVNQSIGLDFPYQRIITAKKSRDFEFIDEQSVLWIDILPNSETNTSHDFLVRKVTDIDENGEFQIYCERTNYTTVDFWYEIDGLIFQKKIPFNITTNVAVIPKNLYLPIEIDETTCWKFNPKDDVTATNGKLVLEDKEDVWDCYVLTFKEVE